MGSQVDNNDEVTILVTGFSPFRSQYPVNPSWEIASRLPSYLPPLPAKDPSARAAPITPSVRILVHPEPVRVNYEAVREIVPSFWDGLVQGRKVDIVLHIGMAGPSSFYQLERQAHRTGYRAPDVDGEKLKDEDEGRLGKDWIWHGLPDELVSDLDIVDVVERWRGHSPKDADLRLSDDPGRYLCDFIYYSSLAHLYKQQRPRKVTFLHVPADASDKNVELGVVLAINLIRSIVESEQSRTPAP